jgi:hypothetical protein
MGLRFQGKNRDMERTVKAERIGLIVLFVVIAGIVAVTSWIKGESLHSYEEANRNRVRLFRGSLVCLATLL